MSHIQACVGRVHRTECFLRLAQSHTTVELPTHTRLLLATAAPMGWRDYS